MEELGLFRGDTGESISQCAVRAAEALLVLPFAFPLEEPVAFPFKGGVGNGFGFGLARALAAP